MTAAGADQGVGASPSAGAEGISPTGRENCEPSHPASFSASSSRLRGTGMGWGGCSCTLGPPGTLAPGALCPGFLCWLSARRIGSRGLVLLHRGPKPRMEAHGLLGNHPRGPA